MVWSETSNMLSEIWMVRFLPVLIRSVIGVVHVRSERAPRSVMVFDDLVLVQNVVAPEVFGS